MRLGLGHGLDVGYRPELFGNLALLQQYPGAAAAYALRNIDGNTATNVVRVRRSSDNAEADFTAAEVSDGTLATWTGANDGHVVTWYDQSGNGKHATQATSTKQPKIVESGVLVTNNGKAAVKSDGVDDIMYSPVGVVGTVTNLYAFGVGSYITAPDSGYIASISDGSYSSTRNYIAFFAQVSGNYRNATSNPLITALNGPANTNQKLFTSIYIGSTGSVICGVNGVDVTSTGAASSLTPDQELTLFAIDSSGTEIVHGDTLTQEIIVYASDQSANRADIESAINSHYSIY